MPSPTTACCAKTAAWCTACILFQVKKPEESKGPWDYYKLLAEVPADQAFRPLKDGGCPLVK